MGLIERVRRSDHGFIGSIQRIEEKSTLQRTWFHLPLSAPAPCAVMYFTVACHAEVHPKCQCVRVASCDFLILISGLDGGYPFRESELSEQTCPLPNLCVLWKYINMITLVGLCLASCLRDVPVPASHMGRLYALRRRMRSRIHIRRPLTLLSFLFKYSYIL